ncbi:unnamed protein product [Urochloa humidicola]
MIPAGAVAVPQPPPPPPPQAAAAAAPPAGGVAARPAWNRRSARVALATALFALGCVAAALAFFAMTLPPGNTRLLGSCVPTTDDDAADLRAAFEKLMAAEAEKLLVAAAGQVLGAMVALLVPVPPVAVFGCVLGGFTSYHANAVLWTMLVSCHGSVHGVLAFHYWLFAVLMWVVLLVGGGVSIV